jgi:N-formylglutamate deformylase
MGVIYEKTALLTPLRAPPSAAERERLLATYYRPHHELLARAVDRLRESGPCLIIDGHSFPSRALPYEPDQNPDRPDFCIGTDAFHTPASLRDAAVGALQAAGFSVAVDRPFAGTMVPKNRYHTDAGTHSIMIEVNRRLYMDEASGEKRAGSFSQLRETITRLIAHLH